MEYFNICAPCAPERCTLEHVALFDKHVRFDIESMSLTNNSVGGELPSIYGYCTGSVKSSQ
jgi:hypothetical protein